ncbi:MAG: molecular chaperone TorD family protein [Proteobacteria bacterium]|nr:molecular chaperone TorD family protein [Pseudomonadota bacterium]MBU1420752.1 molecular chaperone TorD family protein [Pseudomonadota bacterium]MBU1456397.1 molecular chaperone TorD family protein [Pseudomonadota bacterium]
MTQNTELSDRDLCLVRLRFLDLFKSFFQDTPDAERISRWRGIFAALNKERINQQLDTVIRELGEMLDNKDLRELREEYYDLFVDPYSKHLLPLNAAFYLDGKSFGPSLVSYRELLKQNQLIKNDSITDSEDSLLLMLDTLITLVEEEKQGSDMAREVQDQLLHQFLLPTAHHIEKSIKGNPKADFYQKCMAFLCAYLELEQGLLQNKPETNWQSINN